ncbi:hypothetical protein Slu03_11710 [Sediminihabitans luteus]|uniref:LuxR family transcriptional regulator n=1 Tax=Sediminihabitans luteus TaxID=1138585 RepID=UPI000C230225|nr:LuxR family transcriptional regulator [Sediminihabitans luteus]GII98793.1 hypothetical protein Slu03_11710 [Sediminihabitans luteus]
MLTDLGLPGDADDEAVYRAVITAPAPNAHEVAGTLGWEVDEVLAALDRLAAQSFVARADEPSDDPAAPHRADQRWTASPPELVLGPVLARSRERLRRAESVMEDLVETYHRERSPRTGSELVELVEGSAAQALRLRQLERSARREICALQSGSNTVVPLLRRPQEASPAGAPDDRGRTGGSNGAADGTTPPSTTGRRLRIVVDPAYLREPGASQRLDTWVARGEEIRVSDEPVTKLAIADDDVAMVQVTPRTSVMLRRPLVVLARELFEATWRSARPYLQGGAGLEPEDRRILELMLAGLTDAAVATHVGLSARTVQRRVKALMVLAGVGSRVQLGWHAVRQGWV